MATIDLNTHWCHITEGHCYTIRPRSVTFVYTEKAERSYYGEPLRNRVNTTKKRKGRRQRLYYYGTVIFLLFEDLISRLLPSCETCNHDSNHGQS